MEQIKILFFIAGTFFGVDQSRIIAEKTTVTINPQEKTIVILQENLVSLIKNEGDSLKVQNELEKIKQPNQSWSSEFKDYSKKEKDFYIAVDDQTLNLKLTLNYTSAKDLKAFGIDINKDDKFSMTNFPKSHTKSTDGKLGERYWVFETNNSFTFTEEPLTDMPEEFKIYKRNLLSFWKNIKQ